MTAVTSRERVLETRHVQPDRVPHHFSHSAPIRRKLEVCIGTPELDRVLDNHIVKYKPRCHDHMVEVGADLWRDEFGVVWNREGDVDVGGVANSVFENRSLESHALPDPLWPCRFEKLPAFVEADRERLRVSQSREVSV